MCESGVLISRRSAMLLPALVATLHPGRVLPVLAASERVTAQSVGIAQNVGVLADPRSFVDGDGIQPLIWGARARCDPTDAACKQGGVATNTADVQPVPSRSLLVVSDRVLLEISVGGEKLGVVELGLWRSAAPQAVNAFVKLCAGQLRTNPDDEPASLERSVATRVLKDRAVVLGALKNQGGSTVLIPGKTKPQRVPVTPPTTSDDTISGGSHDAAGLISVRKGGGSFEFTLLPRSNVALDKENVVIGQVLNADGMAILERINTLPTDNYRSAPLATVKVERATVLS